MTLNDALNSIFTDLNSYQVIHIVTEKTKGSESITYSIGVALINAKYIFRIESDEYIAVQTYQLDTIEKANSKLRWLIDKYTLTIKSIVYVINMQINELLVKSYKNGILSYTIETKRITREEMLIRYATITHPINYNDFINDFEEVSKLAKESYRKYNVELVLRQEHPLKMIRRLKIVDFDID